MTNDFSELTLTRMIYILSQDMRYLAERILAPYNLTLEQFQTLTVLYGVDPMTQRQLGTSLGKTPGNMTRILDRLEAKTLLERKPDPADRRASRVCLTRRGHELLNHVQKVFGEFKIQIYQGLSDERIREMKETLGIMMDNVTSLSETLKKTRQTP